MRTLCELSILLLFFRLAVRRGGYIIYDYKLDIMLSHLNVISVCFMFIFIIYLNLKINSDIFSNLWFLLRLFKMDISPRKQEMTQRERAKKCSANLGAVNKILKQKRETGSIGVNHEGKCGKKRLKEMTHF